MVVSLPAPVRVDSLLVLYVVLDCIDFGCVVAIVVYDVAVILSILLSAIAVAVVLIGMVVGSIGCCVCHWCCRCCYRCRCRHQAKMV